MRIPEVKNELAYELALAFADKNYQVDEIGY